MDIKWKSKLVLVVWLLLFTCGLNGILNLVTDGSTYLKKDYFQTPQFAGQLDRFIDYLSIFELNYIPKEEAKKLISVTQEEIEEHRYRYGDLSQQISDIKNQYGSKIEDATASGNKDVADYYTAERDRKIEDITNNFKSDEYVKAKIVKEKEQKLEAYYKEQESIRSEFVILQDTFTYHLREVNTGRIFTNASADIVLDDGIRSENMLFTENYETLSTKERPYHFYIEEMDLFERTAGEFEGQIGVAKSAPSSSSVISSYNSFQLKRVAFFIYTVISILAFVGSVHLYRRFPLAEMSSVGRIQKVYNWISLDVRLIGFAITAITALALLLSIDDAFFQGNVYSIIDETIDHLLLSTFFVTLVLAQYKLLRGERFSAAWRKALLYKGYQRLKAAFMIRSTGVQVMMILLIVYLLGVCFAFVAVEEEFIAAYIPMLFFIGIPILWFIIKRAGYFNKIVAHSSEMVGGNFEQDLPVKGKSSLAVLARNLNTLKFGVKTSQKEQAKSERLKTELITNVSHDLRTPLTSIITYTELLKKKDLSEEDRKAYIEIIERKSQRLKVLIDDLFEASKMASGDIQLLKEKVDLVQLLQQALAEHNEAIKESTLQFRVSTPDEPVVALVDGQKLWRVFDNLIGNCLKYSLENTRVYISMKALPDQALITFKNVTKYELSENVDELFERFKRGDASRHTEGSGLGLAIAKSIMDFHDGSLEMEIDGDLFKVTVTINTKY